MEYFVTGATGLIGTHVTRQLIDAGHDVIGLTRSRDNAAHLPDDTTIVEGDITEKASIRDAMAGVDGVFHIAAWFYVGPGPQEVQKAEQINIDGTRNVLELIDELDIPKGVYTSTVGVYPATSGEILDESIDPPCPTFSVYHRTKWEAHYNVAEPFIADGLPLVVVLPSGVYGPHDKLYGSIRGMVRDYLTGDLPVIPRELTVSFDHAADIADAHIRAMEDGRIGEKYIIASDAHPVADVLACAEDLTGIPAPPTIPDAVFGWLATIMRPVTRIVSPPASLEPELLAFLAGRQYHVDNSKATRELGIDHRPLEAGLRTYLAWEIEQLGNELDIDHPPPP